MAQTYWMLRAFAIHEKARDLDGDAVTGRPIKLLKVHWTEGGKVRRREAHGLLNPPGVELVEHLTALRGGDPSAALPADTD